MIERERPLGYLADIDVREGTGEGLGFVSGHTAVAFAIATALRPAVPRWAALAVYALATAVGMARIVDGVHLVVDVVGGAAAGMATALVVERLTPRRSS